ncbi:MAG: NAD(P)H-hydrate dehydratase [Candidatus Bilamarchaeaceae archaeon]
MFERKPWCHKYDFGHLLVVGGNWRYSGSPAFNAIAALRTGVDVVTVAAPERAANIIAGFSPDMITVPLHGDFLRKSHVERLVCITNNEKVSALVVGGGMGRERESAKALKELHNRIELPFVFDADALHAMKIAGIKPRSCDVITPHGGEFRNLFGTKPSENVKERIEQTTAAAKKTGCVILLKGHIDIITDGKKTKIVKKNKYAVYMTKGGTGDVLTGIVGSLLAQGWPAFDAAYYATVINGRAGEVVGKEKGPGLLASDLLDRIPEAIRVIKK